MALCLSVVVQAQDSEPRVRVLLGDTELVDELRPHLQRRGITLVLPPTRAELPDASARLESARRAFEQLEPEQARNSALQWLEAIDTGEATTTSESLLEGLIFLAQVELALGRDDDAAAWVRRARTASPTHALDATRYPPSLRALWEANAPASPRVVMLVGPENLRVGIDGGALAAPPPTWIPGAHVLCFAAPGYLPRCARHEVSTRLDVSLELDPFGAFENARSLTSEVRRAAARLGAAPMLVRREGTQVTIADGGDLGRATVVEGPDRARRLVTLLFTTTPPPPPPRRAWRWVVVGVAAAAAIGAAVGIGVAARNGPDAWEARYVP